MAVLPRVGDQNKSGLPSCGSNGEKERRRRELRAGAALSGRIVLNERPWALGRPTSLPRLPLGPDDCLTVICLGTSVELSRCCFFAELPWAYIGNWCLQRPAAPKSGIIVIIWRDYAGSRAASNVRSDAPTSIRVILQRCVHSQYSRLYLYIQRRSTRPRLITWTRGVPRP